MKTDRFTPEPVAGLHDVLQVAGGQYHTCAVVTGGAVYCWGANDDGQLGIGSNDETATPTRVRGF